MHVRLQALLVLVAPVVALTAPVAGQVHVGAIGANRIAGIPSISRRAESSSPSRSARAAELRAQRERVRRAADDLRRLQAELRGLLLSNSELQLARDAAHAARVRYDALRRERLATLMEQPSFREARLAVYRAEDTLETVRKESRPGSQAIFDAAAELMRHRAALTRALAAELESDEALVAARDEMVDAQARLADLLADIDERIRSDPRMVEARARLDQARRRS